MISNSPNNSSSKDRLARFAVAATLVLLPLVYFFPAVLGKVTLAPGDGWSQIFGIRILIGQMITRGELPLWNPYIFAGMPLLAALQPGVLYPPTWLFAVLSPQWAMNLLVLTTYHLALIGTYLYARRIGINRIGALIAGLTFTFGGYMVAHLGHTNRLNAAAWLPWILLAVEGCWASCQVASRPPMGFSDDAAQTDSLRYHGKCRWVTLGALFIALQLFAGEPQMTLYTVMVAGAYVMFTLLFRDGQHRVWFAAAVAAMLVCGALLSMIQLLPARELLQLGDRAGIDYHYFSQFSLPPRQAWGLFFPYFFGGAGVAPYRVPYWGKWNVTETSGYVGMVAWILALAAIFAGGWRGKEDAARLVRFWAACAVAALLLSFGSNLPLGAYHLMYYVPVYKLFRAPGRHLMEFNFAVGVLAGLGATELARMDRATARRVLVKSLALIAVVVGAGVIAYRFFDEGLVMELPLPAQAGAWSNSELYFPVVFFVLSVAALLAYARRWSLPAGAVVAAMLLLDLMSFGFFYEWRLIDYNITERLADPPTVKFIKQREPDWNAFRIVSYSPAPYGPNQDLLDYPNVSIARGLQSVNGYDPVRLGQMAEIAGRMTLDGVAESSALASAHEGFNLLNAKYLLWQRAESPAAEKVVYDGVGFGPRWLDLILPRWGKVQFEAKATATELAIVSAIEQGTQIADGTPVLNVKLYAFDGRVIERQLLAGRDTRPWTPDSAAAISSWNAVGFRGQGSLAHLKFERAEVERIEFECLPGNADLIITRASLFDAVANASHPLNAKSLSSDRWRRLAAFGNAGGEIEVYENLKVLPRAWFVPSAVLAPSIEVLRTIKTGRLTDGTSFNPAETVLLESELFANRPLKTSLASSGATELPKAEAKVRAYHPNRIEVQTNNPVAGFLVLSEIYYRGWEAWVDGRRASVDRVNFTLRGVELPPGQHNVEFKFRAHSFRTGAIYSAVGLVLLCFGGIAGYRKRKKFTE